MKTLRVGAFALSLACLGACASHDDRVADAGAAPSLGAYAGAWAMDLSPAQDGSYIKEMVITPAADGAKRSHGFTGSVYDGSTFDNGLWWVIPDARGQTITFCMVSDTSGESGGPYYWLGATMPDGTLRGRVQSLARNFELNWKATRKSESVNAAAR